MSRLEEAVNNAPATEFVVINKRLWNAKVDYHVASAMYDVAGFLRGHDSLNAIELDLLGDVRGKRIIHLQCHFGLDTLSLARRGAQQVVGVDFSDSAVGKAQELAHTAGLGDVARFICTDIYDLPRHLAGELFDVVFASYGTINWLPDIRRWAEIVSSCLKPGGRLVMVEFHPILDMFDSAYTRVENSYFNQGPIVNDCQGTYADRSAPLRNQSVEWCHPLSDVIQALIDHGLRMEAVKEFDSSPYDSLVNSVKIADKRYQIKGLEGKIPIVYALKASRN